MLSKKNSIWEGYDGPITSNSTASDIIKNINNDQSQYSFFCMHGTIIVVLLGMYDTITNSPLIENKETFFNNMVGNTNLFSSMEYMTSYRTTEEGFWIPGDIGYVENIANKPLGTADIGYEGENIVYMAGGIYWGHSGNLVKKRSLAEWKNVVGQWGQDGKGNGNKGSNVDTFRMFPKFGLD